MCLAGALCVHITYLIGRVGFERRTSECEQRLQMRYSCSNKRWRKRRRSRNNIRDLSRLFDLVPETQISSLIYKLAFEIYGDQCCRYIKEKNSRTYRLRISIKNSNTKDAGNTKKHTGIHLYLVKNRSMITWVSNDPFLPTNCHSRKINNPTPISNGKERKLAYSMIICCCFEGLPLIYS